MVRVSERPILVPRKRAHPPFGASLPCKQGSRKLWGRGVAAGHLYTSSTPTRANGGEALLGRMLRFPSVSGRRRTPATLCLRIHTAEVAGSNKAPPTPKIPANSRSHSGCLSFSRRSRRCVPNNPAPRGRPRCPRALRKSVGGRTLRGSAKRGRHDAPIVAWASAALGQSIS